MVSELKQKAVKGAGWLGAGQVVSQVISLGVTAVLARLLLPEAFGLVGMVVVFTALLEMFQDLGLTSAVIQRQDVTEEQLSTVFVITVATGALLAGLTAAVGPLIAAFYSEPELATVAKLMGLGFLIQSFVHVHAALLRKALRFRKLVLIRIGSAVCGGAVGITSALLGFGVYALVFGGLARELVFSAVMWATVSWRPSAKFRLRSVGSLLRFGGNVTGAGVFVYLRWNAANLLVGRFLGAGALGIYALAQRIMFLPLRRVSVQLSQVAFPAFSSVQHDRPRVARGYLQMARMVAFIVFPAMGGLLLVAPEAVRVVLGEKWLRAVFLIQVLAVPGALQCISGPLTHVLRSQGRAKLHFHYEIFATALTLAALVMGLRWGIEGVAACYSVSQVLLSPIMCYLAARLVGMTFRDFWRALRAPLLGMVTMAVVVLAYRVSAIRVAHLSMLPLLCSEVALGIAVYVGALRLFAPAIYVDTLGLLKLLRTRHGKAKGSIEDAEKLLASK